MSKAPDARREQQPIEESSGYLLPALYRADADHWWTAGMRQISHSLLDGVVVPAGAILEVGCGAGAFLAQLSERFPDRLTVGSDLHPLALDAALAAQAGLNLIRADLNHLPLPATSYAAIIALDAYDQQGVDLSSALREVWRVLCDGGKIMLRVSAFAWLQGPHDLAFGTGRRFSAHELRQAIHEAGLRLLRMTYANSLLFGPGVAVRLLQKQGMMRDVAQGFATTSQVSRLLGAILAAEAGWLRHRDLPVGLSLYAIAEKPYIAV
jgi:SAM-dependent methyltransferase